MTESVEQAALRRAADDTVLRRARREAAAILDETGYCYIPGGIRNVAEAQSRDRLVTLLAIAWLQGSIYGSHETLAAAEQSFDRLKDALT